MLTAGPKPLVDRRTATDVSAEVRRLLPERVRNWQESRKGPDGIARGPDEALIRIFGRFCEIILDRLNRAPEKNFLAFLDLLGATPLPPQPARAPLTFSLAQKAQGATVPARTQVSAAPAQGEKDPVVFETEQELQVTAATLDSFFVKDPSQDTYTDGSRVLSIPLPVPSQPSAERAPLCAFRGSQLMPHILYLGLNLPLTSPVLRELRLKFEIERNAPASPAQHSVVWEAIAPPPAAGAPAGAAPKDEPFTVIPLTPSSDGTANLTQSGDVVFESFTPLPTGPLPKVEINGVLSQWLRCRFVPPPANATGAPAAPPLAAEGRTLKSVSIHLEIERDVPLKLAFANAVPIDLSKEFFPFGVRPRLGDTLYLASPEAFSLANSVVTLQFKLLNPASDAGQLSTSAAQPPPAQPRDARLIWEFSNGERWVPVGTSAKVKIPDPSTNFVDGTDALSHSGEVSFKVTASPGPAVVNGQKNYWVRVRIAGGDYGAEAHWEQDPAKGFVVAPATLAPPILASVGAKYVLASDSMPDAMVSYEDFRYTPVGPLGLTLLQPTEGDRSAFYLGFAPASFPDPDHPGKTLAQPLASTNLTVYFGLATTPGGKAASLSSPGSPKPVAWEYWSGDSRSWRAFLVHDGTNGLRGSGMVPFLTPRDFSLRREFGRERYWLRAVTADTASDFDPELGSVLLNTTLAVQAVTSGVEVLGSSNGKPNQAFRTTQSPVLEGQILEVLETTMPSVETRGLLDDEEGDDAVSRLLHPFSKREEIWVRWHLVPNFYASVPQSCHYILDRVNGEVKFGDGKRGRIPPALPSGIRMRRYRSGGGGRGNKPAGSIAQLRTTIPYVERAVNLEAASGGADPETLPELLQRAPRGVRHGRRAVTAEDFEDLAMLASPGVGRARCVPLRDLAADPAAVRLAPGAISVIIVPRSADPKPLPSLELCDRVRGFLDEHRVPTADLVLVAADYVAVRVETELAVKDPSVASDVEHAASAALRQFLHPLTGGNGSGWDFGRMPAESDLYALLEGVRGVSHVRRLVALPKPDRPGAERTSRFLIYSSDQHQVTVTLEE